ncbi:MAG: IgGFc-binding protein [Polyangiaceae bacterium]
MGCSVVVGACGSSNKSSGGSSSSGGGNDSGTSDSSSSSGSSGGFGGDGSVPEAGPPPDPTTCAGAASQQSYLGCDYWPTVTANNVWSVFDYAVVVANGQTTPAMVTVTGGGTAIAPVTVAPGQLQTIYLPWVPALKGVDADSCGDSVALPGSVLQTGGAYHLVSSIPVTVYQFNAIEYVGMGGPANKDWSQCPGSTMACSDTGTPIGCYSFSNDASLLLPSTAMTGNYRVLGQPTWASQMVGAYVAITATADNTTVTTTVSKNGSIIAGTGVTATAAGGMLTLMMNAGDVAELVGPTTAGSDLSGSLIHANNPIQVITGLPCVEVPDQALACDHVEESNFPAETFGKNYVVAQPTGPRANAVGHLVRIYGNVDGTTLTYTPGTPGTCPTMVNAGDVVDCGVVNEDFEVTGTNAFAVGVFSQGASVVDPTTAAPNQQGDPDQSLAIPVEQYRAKYVFLAPSDYEENYAVVIEPAGTTITLDGMPATGTATPIGSSGYSVLRLTLSAGQAGAHVLTATNQVGLQVMGYGSYTSYTYPGGLDLAPISPPPAN